MKKDLSIIPDDIANPSPGTEPFHLGHSIAANSTFTFLPPDLLDTLREDLEIRNAIQPDYIQSMAALGTSMKMIAQALSMSEASLQKEFKRRPELQKAYDKGLANMVLSVEQVVLQQAMTGNTQAALFLLKTRGDFKEQREVNHQVNHTIEPVATLKDRMIDKLFGSTHPAIDAEYEEIKDDEESSE